jgi:hypothetical protein
MNDAQALLQAAYDQTQSQVAAADAQAAPLIAEGKRINEQLQPLLARQRELSAQLKDLRGPDYAQRKKLLGTLAHTLGGKRLVAEAKAE